MRLSKLDNYLVAILVFVLIVDPGDLIFKIKTPLFLLIFIVWIGQKIIKKETIKINREIYILIAVFITIPFVGLFSGLLQSSIEDMDFAVGFIKAFSVILLLFVVIDKKIPVFKYLNTLSLIIPIIIIPIYAVIVYSPDSFKSIATYLGDQKSAAIFSFRSYFGLPIIMLYYRTCPLLVFPAAYYLDRFYQTKHKKYLLLVLIVAITLFLSGTRTNILIIALIIFSFVFKQLWLKRRYILMLLIVAILTIPAIIFLTGTDENITDESSQIKSGHLESFGQLFSDHPQMLIWGQGLGSTYYSIGNDSRIVQSELTYIELVRIFGLPIALILIIILIYPLIYLYNNRDLYTNRFSISVAYIAYLIIAASNPLLVSSTGLLAVISMYSYIIYEKKLNYSY